MVELTQVGENNGNTGGEIRLFEGQQDIIAFIRVDGDNMPQGWRNYLAYQSAL